MNAFGIKAFQGPLSSRLNQKTGGDVEIYWLGQAGFVIRRDDLTILIDPYLSDSLAEKYHGHHFPHRRIMSAPIGLDELPKIDWVLITHHHTDHMDPGTLAPLQKAQPETQFVVPRASVDAAAAKIGCAKDRLTTIDVGERLNLAPELNVFATPAAHEHRELDAGGNHRFLGFALDFLGIKLWHSGDTVLFDGLQAFVRDIGPDVALLPVNGRSTFLRSHGIPGNMTLEEAVALTRNIGARTLLAHHYGMFDFNTISPDAIDDYARNCADPKVVRAQVGMCYALSA